MMHHLMTKHGSTPGLEYKFVKFEPAKLDAATGEFTGYASKFGNEDLGGDIVAKGAFTKSLRATGVRGVKMLREHNPLDPIGYWNDLAEDDKGLFSAGKLMIEDLQSARETYALLKNRVLDGLSIGYRVTKASNDRASQVRILEEVELKEISLVLFPMNTEAVIETVKSSLDGSPFDVREFERWLQRDAGLTRAKSLLVISQVKSLLKGTRDAVGEVASTPPTADCAPLVDALQRFNEAIR
jgi:HK97 family phage prohead protease